MRFLLRTASAVMLVVGIHAIASSDTMWVHLAGAFWFLVGLDTRDLAARLTKQEEATRE